MDVFLTVDTEVWCDGWDDLDGRFPGAFERCVYGRTVRGDFGLAFQLQVMRDYGIHSVFFVEPLFAMRFGLGPLEEIVGLIRESGQEIQLHLHTEWVDEAPEPILPCPQGKRQFLKYFRLAEQTTLVRAGVELLGKVGCERVTAFRAGGYGANNDTLRALHANGILIDSSYNPAASQCEIRAPRTLYQPELIEEVTEYPLSTFFHLPGRLRHAAFRGCSTKEMSSLMWQAVERDWRTFVLISHNFELMNEAKTRENPIVVKRFVDFCKFLDHNRSVFTCKGFENGDRVSAADRVAPLHSNLWRTAGRYVEQAVGRLYR